MAFVAWCLVLQKPSSATAGDKYADPNPLVHVDLGFQPADSVHPDLSVEASNPST